VTVPVQTTVAFIGDPGEPLPEVAPPPKSEAKGAKSDAAKPARPVAPPTPVPQSRERSAGPAAATAAALAPAAPTVMEPELFRISPRAAKLARESAIDPAPIAGTGPSGRIVERDVRQYLEEQGYSRLRITPTAKQLAVREGIDLLTLPRKDDGSQIAVADIERILAERPKPMTRMRQIIAQRLTDSFTHAPHFFVTVSADITELEALRAKLKAQGTSYTVTDFIVKAAALALEQFPIVNSTSDGVNVRWHSSIDVGLAVALEQGLVVPVVRKANELTVAEIHTRAQELTAKARAGTLTPAEMTGSTFTISNLGMMDVENFTAIINPGEGAILAVSSGSKQPVVRNDQVVIRTMMKMTLSSDHRLIDGALAARFINSIRKTLEEISLWQRSI
jgi:pyruvate dehydrogenase E2 component (dihydrolipoamide acetyltransferase)